MHNGEEVERKDQRYDNVFIKGRNTRHFDNGKHKLAQERWHWKGKEMFYFFGGGGGGGNGGWGGG